MIKNLKVIARQLVFFIGNKLVNKTAKKFFKTFQTKDFDNTW